ncbi:MAG: arginine--tRNA ligase [Candidatus Sumerlaeaceae bacterium]
MRPLTFQLADAFRAAIQTALGFDADPQVTPVQNTAFGDYQCNAAMGLAKRAVEAVGGKPNPRATAERIVAALDLGAMAEDVSIAGPGFINVRLSPAWVAAQLSSNAADDRLGVEPAPAPVRTVVDYSGPNIAKQMHVGHLRSTIIGDAIARVLEFQAHEVIRQNHLGDWGTQFGMLIAHLRSTVAGAAGFQAADAMHVQPPHPTHHIEDLEQFYREAKERFDREPAFQDEARAIVVQLQGGGEEELKLWRLIVDETRLHYQPIYERLGVGLREEHERGESFYNEMLAEVVHDLKDAGVAERSEGAIAIFSDNFGAPLLIEKTGGGYLYATTDLAAIRYRVKELRARRLIYVHDSRQVQHFAQVFEAAKRAGWAESVWLEFAPFGTMLGEDGKPFKTRTGGTVKLKDLLDEAEERAFALVSEKNPTMPETQRREIARTVGIGAVKYADLSKDRTGDYMFSWDKMLSLEGNTGPYLQYVYTRVRSIFRKAAESGTSASLFEKDTASELVLNAAQEITLAKSLLRFGEIIEVMGRELKPHHLCTYLYDVAGAFSSFYENCSVLQSEGNTRLSRLRLCDATARTMQIGLALLGISTLEQM